MFTHPARRPLFPIPTLPPPHYPSGSSRRSARRFQRASRLVGMSNNAIAAMNTLYSPYNCSAVPCSVPYAYDSGHPDYAVHVVNGTIPVDPVAPNDFATACKDPLPLRRLNVSPRFETPVHHSAQLRLQRSVLHSVRSTLRCPSTVRDDFSFNSLEPSLFKQLNLPLHYGANNNVVPLVASLVSLPAQVGTTSLLDVLPPDLANFYANPANVVLPLHHHAGLERLSTGHVLSTCFFCSGCTRWAWSPLFQGQRLSTPCSQYLSRTALFA